MGGWLARYHHGLIDWLRVGCVEMRGRADGGLPWEGGDAVWEGVRRWVVVVVVGAVVSGGGWCRCRIVSYRIES